MGASAAAVVIELIRARGRATADVALAVIFYGGIAGGVVLISLSGDQTPVNLTAYLFGAITTTQPSDLLVFAALAAVVLVIAAGLAPLLFAVLTAATVVISMRVVGLLLISALMIIPNAVAQQVAHSFRGSMIIAVAVGVGVSVSGTTVSYYASTPSGGTIVLLAIAVFVLTVMLAALIRFIHARRHHTVIEHRHEHGPGCGHPPIEHEGHIDYIHDGHHHAAHGAHYDDH